MTEIPIRDAFLINFIANTEKINEKNPPLRLSKKVMLKNVPVNIEETKILANITNSAILNFLSFINIKEIMLARPIFTMNGFVIIESIIDRRDDKAIKKARRIFFSLSVNFS
ncbi:MAG: hypothetical protein N2258_08550 [Brevinematales bacterium]|nr:hypothetical protein [Brevinematales bacterium]